MTVRGKVVHSVRLFCLTGDVHVFKVYRFFYFGLIVLVYHVCLISAVEHG